MDTPNLGTIIPMAFTFAPRGWASCEGQVMSISSNTALFSLLGKAFGGNGTTTFGLPDLRGKAIIGQGAMPGGGSFNIGATGGAQTVSLNSSNLPAHTHSIVLSANGFDASTSVPTGNSLGSQNVAMYSTAAPNTNLGPTAATATTVGSGAPLNILTPYLAMYYNIALEGTYPQRN